MADLGISYGAVLPGVPAEAFAFVSYPATWPLFFVSVESACAGDDWGGVGGHASLVTRFLGMSVTSTLALTEWDPPHAFRYTARQPRRPDLDNHRVFEPVAGGTRLTGTTRMVPRPGVKGLLDRLSLRVLARVYDKAMRQLPGIVPPADDPRRLRRP